MYARGVRFHCSTLGSSERGLSNHCFTVADSYHQKSNIEGGGAKFSSAGLRPAQNWPISGESVAKWK